MQNYKTSTHITSANNTVNGDGIYPFLKTNVEHWSQFSW